MTFNGKTITLVGGSVNACLPAALYYLLLNTSSDSLVAYIPMPAAYLVTCPRCSEIYEMIPLFAHNYRVSTLEDFLFDVTKENEDPSKARWLQLKSFTRMLSDCFPSHWKVGVVYHESEDKIYKWTVPPKTPTNKTITLKFTTSLTTVD